MELSIPPFCRHSPFKPNETETVWAVERIIEKSHPVFSIKRILTCATDVIRFHTESAAFDILLVSADCVDSAPVCFKDDVDRFIKLAREDAGAYDGKLVFIGESKESISDGEKLFDKICSSAKSADESGKWHVKSFSLDYEDTHAEDINSFAASCAAEFMEFCQVTTLLPGQTMSREAVVPGGYRGEIDGVDEVEESKISPTGHKAVVIVASGSEEVMKDAEEFFNDD